jgi:hypothetical protein
LQDSGKSLAYHTFGPSQQWTRTRITLFPQEVSKLVD